MNRIIQTKLRRIQLLVRAAITLSLVALLSMGLLNRGEAAAGDLDPTFGIGGRVTTDAIPDRNEAVKAIAVQDDGKIVVVGNTVEGVPVVMLVRYNSDGTLDPTFGTNGVAIPNLGSRFLTGEAISIQEDDKIVIAGSITTTTFGDFGDFCLLRFNSDGTVDTAFGNEGLITTDFAGKIDIATTLAIQRDGKFVVAGGSGGGGSPFPFALARYNTDGSLDSTFDEDGLVTTSFGVQDSLSSLLLQDDGKIVAAGTNRATSDFILARYNIDGSLDSSFDGDGKVTTNFSNRSVELTGLVRQTDGRLVAGGTRFNDVTSFVRDFMLVRYNIDGSLDQSFGTDGIVFQNFGPVSVINAGALMIQADDRLLVAGIVDPTVDGGRDFAIARFNRDGSLDTSFGVNGLAATDFSGGVEQLNAAAIQQDGKPVLGGLTRRVGVNLADFALARYQAPLADLEISISDTPDPVLIANNLTYTLTVRNAGPDAAPGVTVADTLPAGVSLLSASATQGGCTGTNNLITCDLGTLASATTVEVTITVTPAVIGTITNTANVTGAISDPNAANNSATEETLVKTPVCPKQTGFWKNHPEAWPSNSLTLGSQSYSQTELLNILNSATRSDASVSLAKQLITAKLNIANGSDPTPINLVVTNADALLAGSVGKLPFNVSPSSATGRAMTDTKTLLERYNSGLLTPVCAP